MRFFPLPSGSVITVVIAIILVVTWVTWGSLNIPETLWAPGDLSSYHADISACSECHEPFRGATAKKCAGCHTVKEFSKRSTPSVGEFHRKTLQNKSTCNTCHTEHRGALAQITVGALSNPHGEFVFRATGTRSCNACHHFYPGFDGQVQLLDNLIVRYLMAEGEGAHRPGKMKDCLICHKGGKLDIK